MEQWPVKLFKKSIVKQVKYRYLKSFIGTYTNLKCLDLGSDNGVISYLFRQGGGDWKSADIVDEAVESIKSLVGSNVFKITEDSMPFPDSEFDTVVIVDLLEHVIGDNALIKEISRVLKKGGTLVVNVPHKKRWSLLRVVRGMLGLTDEQHGHVREGYTYDELLPMLSEYSVVRKTTYSKFFLECIDITISFAFHMLSKKKESKKGTLVTGDDMKKHEKIFKLYSLMYPFLWIIEKFDALLFFMNGYRLIIRATKN